jgi:ribosomal protein S18 acetylase RimI-like enzyme
MDGVASRHDSATGHRSSYGSPVAGDRILDPELAHRLVLHEARAQQTPARELRDLGDGWLFHDPNDAEPFWNRVIAPRWPVDSAAFDRRLDEVITLFATLGRLPHVRPLPVGGAPVDLARRLTAAGFRTLGADRRMVLVEPEHVAARIAATEARVAAALPGATVNVSRQEMQRGASRRMPADRGSRFAAARRGWPERRRWATEASVVLADAFGVGEDRRVALENDVLACVSRPGCAMLLLEVDGEPAAVARRAWTPDGSYLSSIGTRPALRGSGLAALATLHAVRDALEEGGRLVHLAVEVDNEAAQRLYERLGFRLVGDPAPDLLLH